MRMTTWTRGAALAGLLTVAMLGTAAAQAPAARPHASLRRMIRKLASGKFRLYSRKTNPKTGRRRNLGTFATRAAAERHERAVQYFKRH